MTATSIPIGGIMEWGSYSVPERAACEERAS